MLSPDCRRYRLSDLNAYVLANHHRTSRYPNIGPGRMPKLRYVATDRKPAVIAP
jgi:hypothetical protein